MLADEPSAFCAQGQSSSSILVTGTSLQEGAKHNLGVHARFSDVSISWARLLCARFLRDYLSLFPVPQLLDLDASEMTLPLAQLTVMVEQPQPILMLHHRMMCRPPHNRLQQSAAVREWPIRRVARRVGDVMRIAGRVREIVRPVVLV
jgi:hypothetical protein